MIDVRWKILGLGLGAIASLVATSVRANPLGAVEPAAPANLARAESPEQIENQISSIRQLRDVSPQSWSYDALRNLVENYGCIVGYPDGTYRGDRALSRNEFAAGLNACLQQLERRLLEASSKVPAPTPAPMTSGGSSSDSLDSVFRRAFYNDTGRFYEITNISGQLNQIFGWRSFPGSFFDNQIASDALTVETIYYDGIGQQNVGQLIRTRDIANPFDTSLSENPNYTRPTTSPTPPVDVFILP
jgi:hypothetical protein